METQTPSISLNLRPYCNLTYPYVTIADLDKEAILADVKYWGEVLVEIDSIMKDFGTKPATAPAGVEVVTSCKNCGSANLVYSTGTSQSNGKVWYAYDCQDCNTERGGKTYPTRNFANMTTTVSTNASKVMGLQDDDEVPF